MSDIAGPYSSLKILHHPERIAQLRRGEQIVPTHLEMVLSDLCNHDCSWCLTGDTLIETPDGQKRIDAISIGDDVVTPLGGVGIVREVGCRDVSEIMEVIVDGRRLLLTGEHPVLTQDGYKRADELRERIDTAAVSVALNNASVGLSRLHSDIENERGVSSRTTMQVRMRTASQAVAKDSAKVLGALPAAPFGKREGDVSSESQGQLGSNESQESDERCGSSSSCWAENKGQDTEQIAGRNQSYLGCREKENAVVGKSYERNRWPSQGNGKDICTQSTIKERDAFLELVREQRIESGVDGQCCHVGWQEESRFSGSVAKEGYRGNAEGDVHKQAEQANNGDLRDSRCSQVFETRMELLGGVQGGPSWDHSASVTGGDELLHGYNSIMERCLVLRPIVSVRRVLGQFRVYNMSVEPFEAYIANGIVTHNCAYRWTGYTSNELFAKDVPLAQFGTNNPMRMMRKEKAIEIIDDMVEMGIGALECTGGGEPTVHPDCVDIMKYALDKGLDVALVSNGELFRPGHVENLLRCKWVRFSLDAATPEVYAANRRIKGERMHRVTANIKALTDARKQYIASGNKCDLIVGIGFVLNKDNWWEAAACARLAKSLGADNIRISAVFQPDDDSYFSDFYEGALAQCKEARQLEGDGFRVFDNFGDRYQDLVDKNPAHSFCGYQQFTTYVGADESNFRCCLLAYSERGTIGSLKNQRLKDLWSSDKKKKDFEAFDATKCSRCMFGSKLKTILYAIDTNPQHANFV